MPPACPVVHHVPRYAAMFPMPSLPGSPATATPSLENRAREEGITDMLRSEERKLPPGKPVALTAGNAQLQNPRIRVHATV